MSRTVLVTDCAGYVGSHSCKVLTRAGFQLVVFDDLSTRHCDLVRRGTFEKGDILDEASLETAMVTPRSRRHRHSQLALASRYRDPDRGCVALASKSVRGNARARDNETEAVRKAG